MLFLCLSLMIVDSQKPDWTRESLRPGEWSPGKQLLACIRDHHRNERRAPWQRRALHGWVVLRRRFWSAVSGADIPLNSEVGGGMLLSHSSGVVIHLDARI